MSIMDRQVVTMPRDEDFRPILEIAEELGIVAEPSGAQWYAACCPVHDDKAPSLRFNIPENYFNCLGCSQGGNPALFYRFVTGCSLAEAIFATVRRDADAMDDLDYVMDEKHEDDLSAIIAIQLLLAGRVRALDDRVDVEEWGRIMCEADEDHLLSELRSIM